MAAAAATLLLTAALLGLAAPAQAGLSRWTPLIGLTGADGADHVRMYATGTPPTTLYAATEGDGVYRSVTDGLTWEPFSRGLDAPAARDVRVVYSGGGAIWAGTGAGLYKSLGGGAWTPVAQGAEDDPRQPRKLNRSVQAVLSTIGGPLVAGTAFGGVYRSSDGGATWTPPSPSNGMPAGETVWSLTGIGPLVFAATSSGVYRSADWGASWMLASDGIPGSATVLRVIGDGTNPNIVYATTASDGIYRSIDLGLSWQPINDGLGNGVVRGIQQFSGPSVTRLYAATEDGLWTGSTGNGPIPGAVSWRRVTQDGLGGHTIFWAVTTFLTTPGTLLAGTDGDGGFSLTFEPPSNTSPPTVLGTANVGQTLIGGVGSWAGTRTITTSRYWQICTSASSGTCRDVDGEEGTGFTLQARWFQRYLRLRVEAENDFPTPGPTKPTAYSGVIGPIGGDPTDLPGYNQQSAASIRVLPDGGVPKVGDTLQAYGWLFNPVARTTYFQWLRCDENGASCDPIRGADGQQYRTTTADAALRLRVRVSGSNEYGTTVLLDSGETSPIVPDPATALTPPTLRGEAVVGSTLVGGIGSWKSPLTRWERRWELCEADGSGCNPILNEIAPGYVVRPGDLGRRLRMRVLADVNESYRLPAAVEVYTPISAIVTLPAGVTPPPPAPPIPPVPNPPTPPARDVRPPTVKASAKVGRRSVTLSVRTDEAGKLTIVVARKTTGHKKGKRCLKGRKRGAKACDFWVSGKPIRRTVRAGSVSVRLPRGKRGSYRATLALRDAAGNVTRKTVRFTLR